MALAIIVENAGFGAVAAAPIARRVLDYLIDGTYPSEEDIEAVQAGRAAAPIGVPRRVADVPLPRGRDAFAADVPAPEPSAPVTVAVPPRTAPATLPASAASSAVLMPAAAAASSRGRR